MHNLPLQSAFIDRFLSHSVLSYPSELLSSSKNLFIHRLDFRILQRPAIPSKIWLCSFCPMMTYAEWLTRAMITSAEPATYYHQLPHAKREAHGTHRMLHLPWNIPQNRLLMLPIRKSNQGPLSLSIQSKLGRISYKALQTPRRQHSLHLIQCILNHAPIRLRIQRHTLRSIYSRSSANIRP